MLLASLSAASSASSVPACALRRVTDMKLIDLNDRNILVTGSLGFIGASLIVKLLKVLDGCVIVGMDDLSTVDESLRMPRIHRIERAVDEHNVYAFAYGSINDKDFLEEVMRGYEIDIVVNLAGRAGVRQSIDDPDPYIDTNIVGFHNVLEVCVDRNVKHMRHHRPYTVTTAASRKSHSLSSRRPTSPCHCMRQRRGAMSCWHMRMRASTAFRVLG